MSKFLWCGLILGLTFAAGDCFFFLMSDSEGVDGPLATRQGHISLAEVETETAEEILSAVFDSLVGPAVPRCVKPWLGGVLRTVRWV